MPILYCSSCGKKINAPAAAVGKRGQCPQCQTWLVIPERDQSDPKLVPQSRSSVIPPPPPSSPAPADEQSLAPHSNTQPPPIPESAPTVARAGATVRLLRPIATKPPSRLNSIAPGIAVLVLAVLIHLHVGNLKQQEVMLENEIQVANACYQYHQRQRYYAQTVPVSEQGPQYAQTLRLLSDWAMANAEGDPGKASPFHGYCFKTLKAQGSGVSGGEKSYLKNGRMLHGFALVAYPSVYGFTGRHTFMISNLGRLYAADLGTGTLKWVESVKEFNPDAEWSVHPDSLGPLPDLVQEYVRAPQLTPAARRNSNMRQEPTPVPARSGPSPALTWTPADPAVKVHRLAYLKERFSTIHLPPNVHLSPELAAKLKSVAVKAPDLDEITRALKNQDWLEAYRQISGDQQATPSGEEIDRAFDTIQNKQLYLVLNGITSRTATWDEAGVIWVEINLYLGDSFDLITRNSFEPSPDGNGIIHPWRLAEGEPVIVYGTDKDVDSRLRAIEDDFKPKFKALETREKLGESATDLRKKREELRETVRQTVIQSLCGGDRGKAKPENAISDTPAKSEPAVDEPKAPKSTAGSEQKTSGGAKAKSLLNLAQQYLKAGMLDKAQEYAGKVLAEYPNSLEAVDAKAIVQISR